MKKIIKLFMFVAVAAMALASCQKNEFDAPIKKEVQFIINAGIAQTKTAIADNGDKTYTPSWTKGDKIGLFFTEPTAEVLKVDAVFDNQSEDGEIAQFSGTASVAEAGTFYAFYPSSAFGKHYGDGTIRLDLSTLQKPTSTSFDPAYDILVAKPCEYVVEEGNAVIDDLYFTRLMSVLRVNLNGDFAQDEIVESLSISVEGVDIAGNAVVDYKTAEIVKWNNGSAAKNVVTADYSGEDKISIAGTNNSSYLIVAPVTIPEGTNITFEINTKKYVITKTVAAPSDMTFFAGNVSVINLTILEENCEAVDTSIDYSGEYFIAGKEGEAWYAAKKYLSGNYLSVSPLEFDEESIVETEGLADCYMTITKVVGGDYDGMYTIVDAGGKYLSPSSSNSNNMKAVESTSDNTYWTISKVDETGTYSMVATKSEYSRKDMRFNYNNGTNPRVSCYDGSKTSQPYLTLFSTELVKTDPTPKIVVAETEKSIAAEGGELTFAYTLKNLGEEVVTVTEASDFITAVAANGTVTVTVDANETTDERETTITLSCGDADDVILTVTQKGKVVVDSSFESGKYWIVANEKYAMPLTSNYGYLQVDNAGYVDNVFTISVVDGGYTIQQPDGKYLYMTGTYNSFNVSATFPSEGHIWTIAKNEDGSYQIINVLNSKYIQLDSQYGTYGSYDAVKGTMPNLVPADDATDRPIFSVTTTSKNVACDVTEVSFEIVSNQNWTVVPGEGVSVDVTSGSGNGTITMTFAENESEENVVYTAKVKAEGLEDIVVTVNQSGISTGGDAVAEWHTESWRNCAAAANSYASATFEGDLGTWSYTGCSSYDASQFTTKKSLALGKTADNSSITSPIFKDGVKGIIFNYFANSTARKVVVTIYENGAEVKKETITPSAKNTLGSAEISIETSGETYFTFTPGSSDRRVSVGDIQVKF